MQCDIYFIELDKCLVLGLDKLLYLYRCAELIGKILKIVEIVIGHLKHCQSVLYIIGVKHGNKHCPASVRGQILMLEQIL